MKKKNLEKRVVPCVGALISGLNIPKEEIGLDNTTYLHPCMTKYEKGLLKRYSRNERISHKGN